ncbi:MAG: UvrD-helicase domain-containing protein [Planctomycetia bacterium]|nr:UvrD-helicase domain-containing protein [Planctomycetia bacterium]
MSSIEIYKAEGPCLLLAGPGTGKTYTLGLRLKYLIEELEIPPDEITVITFTSEAARNMRNRISNSDIPELYIPYTMQPKNITTMHSLGFKIIRQYHDKLALTENISVIPGNLEKRIIMGDAAQLNGVKREDGVETLNCRQLGECKSNAENLKCNICTTYDNILRRCSSIDYDDQILLAVKLLESNPEILEEYKQYSKHLLVDEYQDINSAQFRLIKLLSSNQTEGLFVVGDDDQSIYSWRGGSPQFIRQFESDFNPNTKVIPLTISYRCHKNILQGSLTVVEKHNNNRLDKEEMQYKIDDGPLIKIHNVASDKKEAKIVRAIVQDAIPSQDVLILVPNRNFANAVSEELRKNNIGFSRPINNPGSGLPLITRLTDWLEDPTNNIALRRCLESFINRRGSQIPSRLARKEEKIKDRENAFDEVAHLWDGLITDESKSLWESIESKDERSELIESIFMAFNEVLSEYNNKGDIDEFIANLSTTLSPWRGINSFRDEINSWVDFIRQMSLEASESSVRIMTYQGAKGLEAKVVCVIGLEEGTMPRTGEGENLQEQSRLLFVSMTRAIHELHLFHARIRSGGIVMRNVFSGSRPDISVSRFLETIPSTYSETSYHR